MAPLFLADDLVVHLEGPWIYSDPLDGPRSGSHPKGDLGALKGWTRSTGGGDQSLSVPEDQFPVRPDIND